MKEPKQRARPDSAVPSGRGTYAKQACSHCRKRKSKCDGRTPVCGPCEKAGRASECTWGKETAKKARTQQHFESLENYIRALESKVKDLQASLDSSGQNHSGESPAASSDFTGESSSIAHQPLEFRRTDSYATSSTDEDRTTSTNESDIDVLISPTRHLVLQDTDLEFHGPTSVWRLGATRSSPSASEAKTSVSPESSPAVPPAYFEWSRYLPSEVPISRSEHDRLLEILFKFFLCWGLRIIPELFLRDMHRALSISPTAPCPKSAHYSPMLHNAVMALATAYSDDPVLKSPRCRNMFAKRAKSYIESDCQKPTIALITALSTLAAFHSVCGDQSLAYLYFGMAGRMSQSLGLRTDCSPWVKSGLIAHADMLDRNWGYWMIFSQDVLWSLYIGRECCVSPPRKDHHMFSVPYIGSEIDQNPWYWAPSKMPPQPSNIVRVFDCSCQLMLIGRKIMDFLNSLGPGSKREGALQVVSELDIQLNNWKDSLAPEVDLTATTRPNALPHRLMVHLVYWWLLLLLHRPFYRRTKSGGSGLDIDHVKLCNRAGDNIMLLLGIWNERYSLRYIPITLMQVVYCAGTSFVLSAVQATSGARLGRVALTSALTQAEQCIQYLLIAGKSFECANDVAMILSNLLHEQLKPRLFTRTLEPKDLLHTLPITKREREGSEYQPQPPYSGQSGSPTAATAPAAATTAATNNDHVDAVSLAATITNIDALRDQCRFAVAANSAHTQGFPSSLEWPRGPGSDGFPVLPLSAASSSSASTSLLAGPGTDALGMSGMDDVEMDFGLTNMDLGLMGGQPLSNRPYMVLGIPEMSGAANFPDLDAPPSYSNHGSQQIPSPQHTHPPGRIGQQPPPQPQQMRLDFSAEELAVMDQILRQQFGGQGIDFRMQPSQRYEGI
ncbi:uncharacterized protein BXZ73DRAFT_89034 [Epithele typhae]|uniref:uncharacterized protein n=1 Tax=Epithele typhae TaxID=378194 RepID=UPI0020082F7B|nr:uncharacterized protein BXZ73DRAFT_89034 [Epithele typhae]KAH9939365.1 hypothetical protein BXZ73DRAFT_89034 [Epithele typhae]